MEGSEDLTLTGTCPHCGSCTAKVILVNACPFCGEAITIDNNYHLDQCDGYEPVIETAKFAFAKDEDGDVWKITYWTLYDGREAALHPSDTGRATAHLLDYIAGMEGKISRAKEALSILAGG